MYKQPLIITDSEIPNISHSRALFSPAFLIKMPEDIIRDGFAFGYDRFYVMPGRVERVSSGALRDMFLPRLTPMANKKLRDHYDFVKCQLKHYDIEYDERELTGNGTKLLKKMLVAGKVRLDDNPGVVSNMNY